ncbi:Prefoldin subunit alpha [uncultured archaeon]|nr:Prefoldin subunit alpha [uncultured archaeon]
MAAGRHSGGIDMADNPELDRIASSLQMQQAKGEAIRTQMQQMEATILEIGAAVDAIQNLKKAKADALVPVGAGVFISCPKPDPDKVVLNIGANVMVSKKPEEAVKLLEERQRKISDAISAAQEDMGELIRAIDELSQRASGIAAAEGKNVRPPKE